MRHFVLIASKVDAVIDLAARFRATLFPDDPGILHHEMVKDGALYARLKKAPGKSHGWPPQGYNRNRQVVWAGVRILKRLLKYKLYQCVIVFPASN